MSMENVCLRIAREDDAEELLDIYAPYVEETAVTFEYEVPSAEEFRNRIRNITKKYPYLVAESAGEILGYAYASAFHERPAFGWVAETSIYLRRDRRRKGLGRSLYEALEEILRIQHITDLCAWIACPEEDDPYLNHDSILFHQHMGYQMTGQFQNCGYKFHRWYHMVWMTKNLGEHLEDQPEVIPFGTVNRSMLEQFGIH